MEKDLVELKTPYSRGSKFRRLVWSTVWACFTRPFPRSMATEWERMLLCTFGAKIAPTVMVYATTYVFQPWLLIVDDYACLAEGVDCYDTALVRIERNTTVNQRAFLCAAGHDISDPYHHQTDASIVVEDRAWVCAEAFIGQGVTIGGGAIHIARAVAVKDVRS